MTPLLDPDTEAAPSVNVIVVPVPKFTAAPVLSVTVGCVPSGASAAPPKVRLLSPV